MDIRQSPLLLGIPAGRWLGTNVRISFLFPLMLVVICFRLGWVLGLWTAAVLVISVIIHEFAHVFGARLTGGTGDEIVLWPLGGLAMVSPAPRLSSELWTTAAGPLSNAAICLICLPIVISRGMLADSLGLVVLPPITMEANTLIPDLAVLFFALNYRLLIVNLLPIYPLDGGQMALSVARQYYDGFTARMGTLWGGMVACMIVMAAGLIVDEQVVTFFGCFLLVFVIHEYFMTMVSGREEEATFGYDFSRGYGAFDHDHDEDATVPPHRPGPLERWRMKREEERREREERERREAAQKLDELLQKVHEHGMNSLTDVERRFLEQASSRYRSSN